MRVIFDTGVIVSAVLLSQSAPRRAFDAAAADGSLLVSKPTVEELSEVLRRPKFDRYVNEALRLEFLAGYVLTAELVEVNDVVRECRDPNDDKFLELSVSGRATHIVTGDMDLLVLHPFRGVSIVTPQAFLNAVGPSVP